ncbi:iron chaperone [Nocardioides taihuensis]|uniref:Iron chaperone n=1 Tax=Nocardioides taihuensis TaxID=1835606 RepID=A0ABW0BDC4_9ACTN
MAEKATQESFTEEERAAMKERAAELKAAGKRGTGAKKAEADLKDCLDKIAEMPEADRVIAEKLHEIVTTHTPELLPKTWYGMPAYARDGKAVVFFKPAAKFKVRYAEVGFNEPAQLDDGDMWPTAYAVVAMNDAVAKKLTTLVKKAAG